MISNDYNIILKILKDNILPAIGCTEPAAIAFSVATARSHSKGKLESINITLDPYLYKNSLRVGIPGILKRGPYIAAALGYIAGRIDKKLEVFTDVKKEHENSANRILDEGKISIQINKKLDRLYIKTILITDIEKIRIVTVDNHLNIVNIERIDISDDFKPLGMAEKKDEALKAIQNYTLEDFYEFSSNIALDKISFLNDGVMMNESVSKKGLENESGIGKNYCALVKEGLLSKDMVSYAEILTSSAVEERMKGSLLPVMSCAGSGNQGITLFLTIDAVAIERGISNDRLLRSLTDQV